MALYIKGSGLGTGCCSGCSANDPCARKPTLSTCAQGSAAYVGISGTWGSYSGNNLSGATWSATGLPTGLSINASTGFITGTPTTAGDSTIVVTVTNACGTSMCNISFTVFDCTGGPCDLVTTISSGGCLPDGASCIDDSFDVTGEFNCATSCDLEWVISAEGASIQLLANGSVIYSTVCETGNSGYTLTVPAGTHTIRIIAYCGCISPASPGCVVLLVTLSCTP